MLNIANIFQASYYYFNVCSLVQFVFFNITLFFAIFVFALGMATSFHRAIFYFYLSAALWFLGFAFTLNAWVDPITFFWGRVTYLAVILVPVTLLHMALIVTGQYYQKRFFYEKRYILWFAYFGVLILFIKTWIDPFFVGITEYPWGFSPRTKDAHLIFLGYSVACFTYALLLIVRHYFNFLKLPQRRKPDFQYRRKLQLVILCFVLTLFSNLTVLNNYGIGIYPFGPLLLFLSVVAMGYALIKYHNTIFLEEIRKVMGEVREKEQEINIARERVKTAKLRLVDAGKASIFASMSAGILHQICQPITAIHGLVKFLKNTMSKDDPKYKSIDLIYEQSAYTKELLNDLLDLMRSREVKKENIDVNICLEKAIKLLRDEFRIKRIEWDFIPAEHLPMVYADGIHLQQIFMNIMVNAIQVLGNMSQGERRYIKIETRCNPQGDHVLIFIENTGPGLSDEEKETIFEPFVSGGDGVGFGLALCKDLLYDHNGDITVENINDAERKGVSFCVSLPIVNA
ncbi:MAG: ATP-binding protein [Candidatus Omnitrophica bacterium]|nr:ATP-binding protein [Candidatus Omnitrophota bacterium]